MHQGGYTDSILVWVLVLESFFNIPQRNLEHEILYKYKRKNVRKLDHPPPSHPLKMEETGLNGKTP